MLEYRTAVNLSPCTRDALTVMLTRYRTRRKTRYRVIDVHVQATLTLAYLAGAGTYRQLAYGNGLDKTTLWRAIQEGITVLARRALPLTEVIRLAAAARWDYLILDGTCVPTNRIMAALPANRRYYCGKHKRHSVNVQTLAAPDGTLLWASGALPGATVDITAARHFHIMDKIEQAGQHTGHHLGVLTDLGYRGLKDAIVGYKRCRNRRTLTTGQRAVNHLITTTRCIGERANAQLKAHKILTHHLRCHPQRITAHIKATLAVHYLQTNPLPTTPTTP
jgi:hypothetical protein